MSPGTPGSAGPPPRWREGGASSEPEAAAGSLLERAGRVPPPGQDALERSWRTLAARRAAPRRLRTAGLALAAAAAAAAALVVWLARPAGAPPPELAELAEATGTVQLAGPGQPWSPAAPGRTLAAGGRVRLAPGGSAALRLGRASVLASGGAEVAVASLGAQVQLDVAGGEVTLDVEPRRAGEGLVVQTARYRVAVKGTAFTVRERSPEDVQVDVRHGLVEVSGQGGRWLVPAGRRWESLRPETLAGLDPPAPAPAAQAPSEAQPGAAPAPVQAPQVEVAVEEPAVPRPASSRPAGHPAAGAHPATVIEAGTRPDRTSVAPPDARAASHPPAAAGLAAPGGWAGGPLQPRGPAAVAALEPPPPPGEVPERAPEAEVPARPLRRELLPPPVSPPGPPPADDQPYARAVALSREGRHPEAAAALEAVAGGGGPHAELALYELGRLQQLRLGQPRLARQTYARYQRAYPQGTLSQEVELSTLELQLQGRELDAALATLDAFLRRHPASERVDELRVLRGDVLRERGDCAGALGEFERVRSGPQADDALYFAGWCQQRLGRPEAAAATWRGYLERFPEGRHRAEARAALQGRDEKR